MRAHPLSAIGSHREAIVCGGRRAGHAGWLRVLTVVSTLLWSALVAAQPQDSIGQVASLQGQATVQRAGSVQSMSLSVHSPVYRDDTIQTLEASKIKLLLIDGTELTLGEHSAMTLSKLVYAPQQNTHQGVVSMTRGFFRAVARKVLPQTTFEVRTGTAVAAVRGTQWLGEVTPDATAIVVLHGEVAVVQADTSVRGEVVLTPGLGTDVQGKKPPTAARKWPEERVFKLLRATALP
jgi:hypothetical protein